MEVIPPRGLSPPPTYEEATADQPPRCEGLTDRAQTRLNSTQCATRSSPIVRNQVGVIVEQPRRHDNVICEQARNLKQRVECNCLCSSCKWTLFTCDCELFCFNSPGLLSYLLLCAPCVYICWSCGKICPETYGDCPARDSSLVESFDDWDHNLASRCCWFCLGPFCCVTCDRDREVCPLSEPWRNRFGVCSVLKKMTCSCLSYKLCRYKLNVMDEQAFGFVCDCKDIGCICGRMIET